MRQLFKVSLALAQGKPEYGGLNSQQTPHFPRDAAAKVVADEFQRLKLGKTGQFRRDGARQPVAREVEFF